MRPALRATQRPRSRSFAGGIRSYCALSSFAARSLATSMVEHLGTAQEPILAGWPGPGITVWEVTSDGSAIFARKRSACKLLGLPVDRNNQIRGGREPMSLRARH